MSLPPDASCPPSELDTAPVVSVVVPMRNEIAHLAACLQTLLAQDYPRDAFEIIVVDGESHDGSREMVERIARVTPTVRVMSNPKRVIPAALNLGVRAARGRIILRADCKARYARDYVSMCVHYLRTAGALNVGGPCRSVPGAASAVARCIAAICTHPLVMGGSRYRTSLDVEEFADGAVYGAWHRELFERIGYFNEALERGEDNEFNSRILRAGGRILKTPRIVVHYLCRPTLTSFLRQTFGNGLWHFLTVAANRSAFRARYFAPAAWVSWLTTFSLLSTLDDAFAVPLAVGVSAYGALLAWVTAMVLRAHGPTVAACVPMVVSMFHATYGLATLAGIVRFGVWDPGAVKRAREGARAAAGIDDLLPLSLPRR
ncbi:MAG: glycosyltransferase family 2 protein [Vicinamibacterales bacterium]